MVDAREQLDALNRASLTHTSPEHEQQKQQQLSELRQAATAALGAGIEVLQRARALNPLNLNTLQALAIAYEFVKQPSQAWEIEEQIKALRRRYPNLGL